MNIPSSPRFYAIISSAVRNQNQDTFSVQTMSLQSPTPTIYAQSQSHYSQLSPILAETRDVSRWQTESLPAPRSVGQTSAPENNHWLNIGDRFIVLGGDSDDFKAYIVEASHRAALVPFEAKITHRAAGGTNKKEYWVPYVEAARVFINPGKPWYRALCSYESMAQARDMGIPKRKWLFLDGRDQPTRDAPSDLALKKTLEFVQVLLGFVPGDIREWDATWEMMVGTAEGLSIRSGWSWKEDLRFGFCWPPDVGMVPSPASVHSQ
ncbi:hypothetical protein FRB99_002296 [Tulasnella sp. 403]|nr:hypothetical protein FRB99_002296 [Tulasnella sp. 403]